MLSHVGALPRSSVSTALQLNTVPANYQAGYNRSTPSPPGLDSYRQCDWPVPVAPLALCHACARCCHAKASTSAQAAGCSSGLPPAPKLWPACSGFTYGSTCVAEVPLCTGSSSAGRLKSHRLPDAAGSRHVSPHRVTPTNETYSTLMYTSCSYLVDGHIRPQGAVSGRGTLG
jgi:hypothetical protein